ncbi:hypothetical protein F2P79_022088 [Pimephales promelas]|nr:hypothetical protein F2P79_022088 [Pimephales promelas]
MAITLTPKPEASTSNYPKNIGIVITGLGNIAAALLCPPRLDLRAESRLSPLYTFERSPCISSSSSTAVRQSRHCGNVKPSAPRVSVTALRVSSPFRGTACCVVVLMLNTCTDALTAAETHANIRQRCVELQRFIAPCLQHYVTMQLSELLLYNLDQLPSL